ncbi:MAG: redoxin domain-containing protein [Thermodesulfovibrionales bacterium]|nr:redoxin domain-containing protein [Thermodesulfovibrionales bacterium]
MRCGEEIPLVKGMEKAFQAEGLKIIWIGFQDREPRIKAFAEKNGIRESLGYDKGDETAKKFGVKYGAGLVVINSEGIVKARLSKGFSGKKLHEAVRAALSNSAS